MAKEAIIEKLEHVLTDQVENECQVIYILTRMRKILEINDQKKEYGVVNFYSDWALHPKLTHANTTSFIALKFEPHIDVAKSSHDIAKLLKSTNPGFFKLDDLKNEFKLFCEEYGLSTKIFDVEDNWHDFMRLLLEIIKDCPIVIKNSKIKQMTLVGSSLDDYSYKFNLVGTREIPIVKLKLKGK